MEKSSRRWRYRPRGPILTRTNLKLYSPTLIWARLSAPHLDSGVVGEFRYARTRQLDLRGLKPSAQRKARTI